MPLKIVYIDDEPLLCECFADEFSSATVQIMTFGDSSEALDYINAEPPDLIFIDYRLPKITGDELALKIDPNIPKVLITGDFFVKSNYPFVKIFQKPVDHNELVIFIADFIQQRHSTFA